MWSHWILVVCLWKGEYSNAEISQTPNLLVLQEGENASLRCTQTDGHERMYWYRQGRELGLQFLYHFYFENEQEKGNGLDRFKADRPETPLSNLHISRVERKDSAVYFCATRLYTAFQRKPIFLPKLPYFGWVCAELDSRKK